MACASAQAVLLGGWFYRLRFDKRRKGSLPGLEFDRLN